MINLLQQFTDPYERNARVVPALLVALPILVPLVAVYGPKDPLLTAVGALMGGCGVIYALASVARGRGKALEEHLIQKWGGLPSKLVLRHRDTHFDRVTKKRYHDSILEKLNIRMPTEEEEAFNPGLADEAYMGVTWHMRELTRNTKNLLLKENIAYGFHRNMLGMKSVGILTSTLGFLLALVVAKIAHIKSPYISLENIVEPGLPGGISMLVSASLFAAWAFYFNEDKVRRMGYAYAERLFEQLSAIPKPQKKMAR